MKNKIVFLDAGTVDYGDISFDSISKLGDLKLHFKTEAKDVAARSKNADIIITNKCIFDQETLAVLPNTRLIALTATGTNNVDLAAAKKAGIAVANVPGYSTESVVQGTFAFILALAGNLVKYDSVVRQKWSRSAFFMASTFPVREVHGKTLGIVGYGQIGKRVAEVAKAFGMKVLVARMPGRTYPAREKRTPLATLLKESDFVTVHAPLLPSTERIVNASFLSKMKKSAFVINMARGGLVDEKALYQALKSGQIAGAAADVLSAEPPPPDHILFKAPNFLLTPHMAWGSVEARTRLMQQVALNIYAFSDGKKRNRVA